jgi:hypothetical protein
VTSPARARRPSGDFVPTEELIRQQGTKPLKSIDALPEHPFSSYEEYAEFLADLYASRHAGSWPWWWSSRG